MRSQELKRQLMKIPSFFLATTLPLFLSSQNAIAQPVTATVESITDGDTFTVSNGQTIQLACIDAIEGEQPLGENAAQELTALIPPGANVQLIPVETDQYGRMVAVVFASNQQGQQTNVNWSMLRKGWAAVYTQHLARCPSSRQDFLDAQETAANLRLGIWSQSRPCLPWDFRAGRCGR